MSPTSRPQRPCFPALPCSLSLSLAAPFIPSTMDLQPDPSTRHSAEFRVMLHDYLLRQARLQGKEHMCRWANDKPVDGNKPAEDMPAPGNVLLSH